MRPKRHKFYLATGLFLAAFGVYCAVEASGADRDLVFSRQVPTQLSGETLSQSIHTISNWPNWFYSVAQAERIDLTGKPFPSSDQVAAQGALVRLEVRPHKGERRGSFDLWVQVSEYLPGKSITLSLVKDQAGRIAKQVGPLQWKIDLKPGLIVGTELAHTHHWRARLMASLSERILMNQLFYPNLMALAEFTQPSAPNPFPAYGQ